MAKDLFNAARAAVFAGRVCKRAKDFSDAPVPCVVVPPELMQSLRDAVREGGDTGEDEISPQAREVAERYRRQPEPTPPFNWHEVIIGCLGEGVNDEDVPDSEYRRSLVEAGALVIGAIAAYDRHFTGGQQGPECDVCGTRHGVKGFATGDGWKTLRCEAHEI